MGNSSSQTANEKRQEEVRQKFGVLVPPSFIVVDPSSDPTASLPISCQTRLKSIAAPNVLNDLWTMNQGRQLLETYMTPGVTLSVPTATQGQILVALNTTEGDKSSFLWAEQPLSDNAKAELLVPTVDSPHFHMRYKQDINENTFWAVRGQVNTQQKGWVESRLKSTYDDLDILFSVSSSLPSPSKDATRKDDIMDQVLNSVHLQAAAEYKESLVAVQGGLDQNQLPTLTGSMVSLNLNHQASDKNNAAIDGDVNARVPPLWLTLKQLKPSGEDTTKWTLNLSQILTFDRYVWNVMEERAPKVRQILGWSLQMDTTTASNDAESSSSTPETKWSIGTTWQVNRGLAFKGVMTTSNTSPLSLNYGFIVKRWMQPRATLSVLSQFEFATKKSSFLGFGLELEASPFTLNSTTPTYPNSPSPDYAKADEAAPTKVFIPERRR
ncbi:unnamed protein product [Cylindrotheca closterium]|uniref:Uncharacterized protein n=1 Tax=Cylindrotheca closterium TaxID=2856 RepID=A0AAD2G7K1_9STRA|nr:unnamed protein product [Cylindrotheca closterium]